MLIRKETIVGLFIIAAIGVFFYMTFQIGTFRFDRLRYQSYYVYFNDISGLAVKADVKISGVKVGWVESVELINNNQQVRAKAMIHKKYQLHSDANGMVRQEGVLGSKYLEIIPGDPLLPTIRSGGTLMKPSGDASSIDQLLQQFKKITSNVEEVTISLKNVFGGAEGQERLQNSVKSFDNATSQLARIAESLNRIVVNNQDNINSILGDVRDFSKDIREQLPTLIHDISAMSHSLSNDFNHLTSNFDSTSKSVGDITDKINNGTGVISKLINDQELSRDIKTSVEGLKEYLEKIRRLTIVVDGHTESFHSFVEKNNFRNAAGEINMRIHPTDDYFYLVGLYASQKGSLERIETIRHWYDGSCNAIVPDDLPLDPHDRLKFAEHKEKTIRHMDSFLYNLQVGKVFGNVGLRTGLFQSTLGIAVDLTIPFGQNLHFVSSLEGFDFRGRQRWCDTRPHIKWINKVFFTPNLYMVLGADDFVSRQSKSAFVGVGLRFGDDDLKYLASKIPGLS